MSRYRCYEKFGGKIDLEYLRLIYGNSTKEVFFDRLWRDQKTIADSCYLVKYNKNTIENLVHVKNDPVEFPYGCYKDKFKVQSGSYFCKASAESY